MPNNKLKDIIKLGDDPHTIFTAIKELNDEIEVIDYIIHLHRQIDSYITGVEQLLSHIPKDWEDGKR
jgi:hypothetical protein